MIKFISQLILTFIFTAIVWTNLFNFFSLRIHPYDYPMWKYKFEILNNPSINPEIIVLGDSLPNAAISPELISNNMINLSLSGGTPIEAYIFLFHYLETHKKPKRIVLSFNPDSFHFQETYYYHAMMFNLFTFEELIELGPYLTTQKALYLQGKDLPENLKSYMIKNQYYRTLYWLDLIISKLSISKYQLSSLPNFFDENIFSINRNILSEISTSRGQHFFSADGTSTIPSQFLKRSFAPDRIHSIYFEKLLALIDRNAISVSLITPPLNVIYKSHLETDYFLKYFNYIKNFNNLYPKLKFSTNVLFLNPENFNDPDHVNSKGMNIYSKYVKNILEQD